MPHATQVQSAGLQGHWRAQLSAMQLAAAATATAAARKYSCWRLPRWRQLRYLKSPAGKGSPSAEPHTKIRRRMPAGAGVGRLPQRSLASIWGVQAAQPCSSAAGHSEAAAMTTTAQHGAARQQAVSASAATKTAGAKAAAAKAVVLAEATEAAPAAAAAPPHGAFSVLR